MRLSKCFGIISWLPNKEPDRKMRQDRINRLFKQLNTIWPEYPILIITQNWKDFTPNEISNEIIRVDFKGGLGILGARKQLRSEFLKRNFDYLIMLDDDAIIHQSQKGIANKYMQEIDNHKNGFAFIHHVGHSSDINADTEAMYAPAQLNLCAISRYIYAKEDMPNLDPQKGQGYEDLVFSNLLHIKYSENEFIFPEGIRCIQFLNKNEKAPSTWWTTQAQDQIYEKSKEILQFIVSYKDLPDLDIYNEHRILVRKGTPKERVSFLLDIQKRREENAKKSKQWFSII